MYAYSASIIYLGLIGCPREREVDTEEPGYNAPTNFRKRLPLVLLHAQCKALMHGTSV